jgi:predicted N-acetyltransferase YhbS
MKSCVGRDIPTNSIEENNLLDRKYTWRKEWANHDPVRQHWHLGPLGVLPAYRGMGIGSELMRIFCKEVDSCSAQAYLETDLDENVRFYQTFGFEVIATSKLFQVENHYMLRVPKT